MQMQGFLQTPDAIPFSSPERASGSQRPTTAGYSAQIEDPAQADLAVAALRKIHALDGLSEGEYRWLASHSVERCVTHQSIVFEENEPAHHLLFLLEGEVLVHRRKAGAVSSFLGRTGQITGRLPYSRMLHWAGEGRSSGSLWMLEIDEQMFPAMLHEIPSMTQRCVSILLDRVRDFTRADLQAEKLVALGKLAANLSHELKNPASAAERAALTLGSAMTGDLGLCRLGRLFRSHDEMESYLEWFERSFALCSGERHEHAGAACFLLESDREDRILSWLEAHGVLDGWNVAPALASSSLPISALDELANLLETEVLSDAVAHFAHRLDAATMLGAISESSGRIFRVVNAIQDYSYMDQAPIQEIDLARSIESALAFFSSRFPKLTVLRDYETALPVITAYGAELSQVWTALIENAIDATEGTGVLEISTRCQGEMVLIEVRDDGSGIDPAITSRIFEPFFTTKPLGEGLGLGLDLVRRIVSKHFGSITVQSEQHSTCFQVRLPTHRPQIY